MLPLKLSLSISEFVGGCETSSSCVDSMYSELVSSVVTIAVISCSVDIDSDVVISVLCSDGLVFLNNVIGSTTKKGIRKNI